MRPEWARRAVWRSGRLDLVLWWLVWMPFRARFRRFAKWLYLKTNSGGHVSGPGVSEFVVYSTKTFRDGLRKAEEAVAKFGRKGA